MTNPRRMMMAAAGSAGGSRYIGELWTWGDATNGKLGNGTSTGNLCSPEQVGADSDWMIVAESVCGNNADHCIIMKEDYTLWGFGTNTNYELGLGDTTNRSSPVQIGSDSWVNVTAGSIANLGVQSDGTLWGWGLNSNGYTIPGVATAVTVPTKSGLLTDWGSTATGGNQRAFAALKSDDTLWAWGSTNFNPFSGDVSTRTSPTQVGTATNWFSLSGCDRHHGATNTANELWMWGFNYWGQLGDGTNTTRKSPVQIGSAQWESVHCCYNRTFAVRTDGTLWAWGVGWDGGLGTLGTTTLSSPAQVGSAADWSEVSLSGGRNFSIGVKADNTIWSWGDNTQGMLGHGGTTDVSSPVQIGADSNWGMAQAGLRGVMAIRI